MTKNLNNLCKIFFIITFCLSCFTMNSDKLFGYLNNQGTVFILIKLSLVFVIVFISGLVNRKNISFITKFEPKAVIIITIALIFDYYVTQLSGSQFLYRVWWIAAVFIAQGALFLSMSIFKNDKYNEFYKHFWYGFTPLYLFILIICFLRNPFHGGRTMNTVPFHGTFLMLKAFVNDINVSFEAPLIFFGNLLIFVPLPFILFSFLKKAKPIHIALIGFITPIIIEGYQYVFSCGDVDVDDLILNWTGFFAGFVLQRIIYKRLIKN